MPSGSQSGTGEEGDDVSGDVSGDVGGDVYGSLSSISIAVRSAPAKQNPASALTIVRLPGRYGFCKRGLVAVGVDERAAHIPFEKQDLLKAGTLVG